MNVNPNVLTCIIYYEIITLQDKININVTEFILTSSIFLYHLLFYEMSPGLIQFFF